MGLQCEFQQFHAPNLSVGQRVENEQWTENVLLLKKDNSRGTGTYTPADYPEYHSWLSDLFAPLKLTLKIAEEHDSATSLIASVEAGRGVALVQQGFDCLTGPRLKVRPLTPAPLPLVVGIAYRKENNSAATENFIAVAKREKSAQD